MLGGGRTLQLLKAVATDATGHIWSRTARSQSPRLFAINAARRDIFLLPACVDMETGKGGGGYCTGIRSAPSTK